MVAFFTSSSTSQVRQGKPLEFWGKEDYWVHGTIVCGKVGKQGCLTGRQQGCLVMGLGGQGASESRVLGVMVLWIHETLVSRGLGVTGHWDHRALMAP